MSSQRLFQIPNYFLGQDIPLDLLVSQQALLEWVGLRLYFLSVNLLFYLLLRCDNKIFEFRTYLSHAESLNPYIFRSIRINCISLDDRLRGGGLNVEVLNSSNNKFFIIITISGRISENSLNLLSSLCKLSIWEGEMIKLSYVLTKLILRLRSCSLNLFFNMLRIVHYLQLYNIFFNS
jgi:hypothetical protein